jgi:hypothetical protein
MEAFCRMMRGHGSIWYATLTEVTDYIAAARALENADDGAAVTNRSNLFVWISKLGIGVKIPAGATLDLNAEIGKEGR